MNTADIVRASYSFWLITALISGFELEENYFNLTDSKSMRNTSALTNTGRATVNRNPFRIINGNISFDKKRPAGWKWYKRNNEKIIRRKGIVLRNPSTERNKTQLINNRKRINLITTVKYLSSSNGTRYYGVDETTVGKTAAALVNTNKGQNMVTEDAGGANYMKYIRSSIIDRASKSKAGEDLGKNVLRSDLGGKWTDVRQKGAINDSSEYVESIIKLLQEMPADQTVTEQTVADKTVADQIQADLDKKRLLESFRKLYGGSYRFPSSISSNDIENFLRDDKRGANDKKILNWIKSTKPPDRQRFYRTRRENQDSLVPDFLSDSFNNRRPSFQKSVKSNEDLNGMRDSKQDVQAYPSLSDKNDYLSERTDFQLPPYIRQHFEDEMSSKGEKDMLHPLDESRAKSGQDVEHFDSDIYRSLQELVNANIDNDKEYREKSHLSNLLNPNTVSTSQSQMDEIYFPDQIWPPDSPVQLRDSDNYCDDTNKETTPDLTTTELTCEQIQLNCTTLEPNCSTTTNGTIDESKTDKYYFSTKDVCIILVSICAGIILAVIALLIIMRYTCPARGRITDFTVFKNVCKDLGSCACCRRNINGAGESSDEVRGSRPCEKKASVKCENRTRKRLEDTGTDVYSLTTNEHVRPSGKSRKNGKYGKTKASLNNQRGKRKKYKKRTFLEKYYEDSSSSVVLTGSSFKNSAIDYGTLTEESDLNAPSSSRILHTKKISNVYNVVIEKPVVARNHEQNKSRKVKNQLRKKRKRPRNKNKVSNTSVSHRELSKFTDLPEE